MFELETKWDGDAIQRSRKVKKSEFPWPSCRKKKKGILCTAIYIYKGSLTWKIAFTSQSLFQTESGLK